MQIIENTRTRSFLIEFFRHFSIAMFTFAKALRRATRPCVLGEKELAFDPEKPRQYPVEFSTSTLDTDQFSIALPASLLPPWANEGTQQQVSARLNDPAQRAQLLDAISENINRRGGANTLLFTSPSLSDLYAKTLARVSAARKTPAPKTALAILQSAARDKAWDQLGVISFNMNEADIDRFMCQPWVMTDSDGSPGHPRLYGTFPRKLRIHVYQKKLITLPFMVHVSSELPAEMLGLHDRGLLRQNYIDRKS